MLCRKVMLQLVLKYLSLFSAPLNVTSNHTTSCHMSYVTCHMSFKEIKLPTVVTVNIQNLVHAIGHMVIATYLYIPIERNDTITHICKHQLDIWRLVHLFVHKLDIWCYYTYLCTRIGNTGPSHTPIGHMGHLSVCVVVCVYLCLCLVVCKCEH